MKRCLKCKQEQLHDTQVEESIEVGEHTFTARIPVTQCGNCGELYFQADILARFELTVATLLAKTGVASCEAIRFMRKAIQMRAAELADLLDVTPETVSRWETGKLPVERRALALLGSLVIDKFEGHTSTLDRLRELREPKPLNKRVRLELAAMT